MIQIVPHFRFKVKKFLLKWKRLHLIVFTVLTLVIFTIYNISSTENYESFTWLLKLLGKDYFINCSSFDCIFAALVYKTVPSISAVATNMTSCNYEQLICDNRFIDQNADRNALFDAQSIRAGGEFIPKQCMTKFSTAIIVPYRNRSDQLETFLIYMHNFLREQNIHYRIYLIEQADRKPFNRAKLFNIGYIYAARAQFPCLIFNDVDLLPLNLGNLYVCTQNPRHLAVNLDKYNFAVPYRDYFGGSVSIQTDMYKAINGMSNVYFGWGGEDDDLFRRLINKQIKIVRFGKNYSQYTMIKHKQETPNPKRQNLLDHATQRFEFDGLNSLEYTEKRITQRQLYTHIEVEI